MNLEELKGSQKKYLRGLAHNLNPSAFIGQKGITQTLIAEIDKALEATELIKVKFNDFKEKDQKNSLINEISKATQSHIAGMIGHVAILYRQNKDVEKQQIRLP
ncbi:ribosome assembly RNA-binding protein YhbY [Desulfobacula toluolica]|uniref:ribosome assembly RNA-binding protein YhbY n=1 Tax=Desulfobacula toluolica TaxID=28223 RepID=UPI002FC63210